MWLDPIVYEEGEWEDWSSWSPESCSRTCGAEFKRRFRKCSKSGACIGDYLEEESCNNPDCGEF